MPNFSLPDSVFEEACAIYPTPFHLYDETGIRQNARALNAAFAWCPDFKEYFAVKALPTPAILRILREEGCGVDCSSDTELMLADACGFSGEEIMFSANAMPYEEFAHARRLGAYINLDDITHIDILKQHGGIPETVCLRYNPGGSFTIGTEIMGNPGEAKYGFTYAQLQEGLKQLKALGVKRFGLHAFLSSNNTDAGYYPALAQLLFKCGRDLSEESGLPLAFINLSGGVGIPYRPDQAATDIQAVGEGVRQAYEAVFPEGGVAIKTELGRWMTGPMGWLVTHATHKKDTYKHYIGLDACAANLMRPAMYGAYHHITVCGKREAPLDHRYDVTGSLCENNDKFAVDRDLPEIVTGDIVVIHDTGAHGFAMGYNYNGRLRSAEVLRTLDGGLRLIRRAETAKDYFATLDVDECASKLE
ncbi:MAG: diaminopimelate decarboxylase [Christensenellaceae bacterium]|nr:diaminopimelate decarboxylase [Christensenellaceae bacterium]